MTAETIFQPDKDGESKSKTGQSYLPASIKVRNE
jgi:hypothetical protein